jgi:hypothetical protein
MAQPKSTHLTFNPHNQNLESINLAIKSILGKAGCGTCGRLLTLTAGFLGDPPDAEMNKAGVISVEQL